MGEKKTEDSINLWSNCLRKDLLLLFVEHLLISVWICTMLESWMDPWLLWRNIGLLILKTKLQLIVFNCMEDGVSCGRPALPNHMQMPGYKPFMVEQMKS